MTQAMEQQFVERMRALLVSLPYDLKVFFEMMADEEVSTDARQLATAAVIYTLSPADAIPDNLGLVGFVDDVIAVRLVLERVLELSPEQAADYRERFPEQFAELDADLELFRNVVGDDMDWLVERMQPDKLKGTKYKGKTVEMYAAEQELGQRLYEDSLEFATEYEIDDDAAQKLASAKPVLDAFKKRRQFEESRRSG